jgi:hypothetical protein
MISSFLVAHLVADKVFVVVIIGAIAMLVGITRWLRAHGEPASATNTFPYRERFQQMKVEAEARYGPSVELLRPEMELDDDPELFAKAWDEFEKDYAGHIAASR